MNPKYTTAGLAFGILIALAPETALAQNPKPQVRQKASARSTSPASKATDSNPSDLPIGVLQGIEDAKRYQELVRRAAREGQPAPPLPYATSRTRSAAVPPAGAAYAPPPGASTAPSQPEVSSGTNTATTQYQPVMIPVMVPVPASRSQATQSQATQSLSTDPFHLGQPLTVRPDLVFGQRPQPGTPPPSVEDLRRLREYIEAQQNLRGSWSEAGNDSGFDLPSSPSPVDSAPSSQPISMPGPAPESLPFGGKP